ncbi:hypothetical protein TWF694_006130 [Orbilia ellipsospora]|uniref:C2H2-type domain-containing protein n=1 Tax=Orbilia ellipsospora TaxID=2528407 RepID=A0AAV9WSR1_9PEZI
MLLQRSPNLASVDWRRYEPCFPELEGLTYNQIGPKIFSDIQHAPLQLDDTFPKYQRSYHYSFQIPSPNFQVRPPAKAHVPQLLVLNVTRSSQQMSKPNRSTSVLSRRQSNYALWRPDSFESFWNSYLYCHLSFSVKLRLSLHIQLFGYDSDRDQTLFSSITIHYIPMMRQIPRGSASYNNDRTSVRPTSRYSRACASGDSQSSRARNPRWSSQRNGGSVGGRASQKKRSRQSFSATEGDGGSDGGDGSSPKRSKSFPVSNSISKKYRCPFGSTLLDAYKDCHSVRRSNLRRLKEHLQEAHFKGVLPRDLKIADNWNKVFKICFPSWRQPIPDPYFPGREFHRSTFSFERPHSQCDFDNVPGNVRDIVLSPKPLIEDDETGNILVEGDILSDLHDDWCKDGDYVPADLEEAVSMKLGITSNERADLEDSSSPSTSWRLFPDFMNMETMMDSTYPSSLPIDFPKPFSFNDTQQSQLNEKFGRNFILYILNQPESSLPLKLEDCKRFSFPTLAEMVVDIPSLFKKEFQDAPFNCDNWGIIDPITKQVIPDVGYSPWTSWWKFLEMNPNGDIELYFCVDTPIWNATDNMERTNLARFKGGWDVPEIYKTNKIIAHATRFDRPYTSRSSMFTDSFKSLSLSKAASQGVLEYPARGITDIPGIKDSKPNTSVDSSSTDKGPDSKSKALSTEDSASASTPGCGHSPPQVLRAKSFRKILKAMHSQLEPEDGVCSLKRFSTRLACPFAKKLPELYISCLAINCGSLEEVKNHLMNHHHFSDRMEELKDCASWHEIFDFCFQHAKLTTQPSAYFSFIPLIHHLQNKTDIETGDSIDLLTEEIKHQEGSSRPGSSVETSSVGYQVTSDDMDDTSSIGDEISTACLDEGECLDSLDFVSDQDMSPDSYSNGEVSDTDEQTDEENTEEAPTTHATENDGFNFTETITEIPTPDGHSTDKSTIGDTEVVWKIRAIYTTSLLVVLRNASHQLSKAIPDQAQDGESGRYPKQCPATSPTSDGANSSSNQNNQTSVPCSTSHPSFQGDGIRRRRRNGRRRDNGSGKSDKSGIEPGIPILKRKYYCPCALLKCKQHQACWKPRRKYCASIQILRGHIRRDHYQNMFLPDEFQPENADNWPAFFKQCQKICKAEYSGMPTPSDSCCFVDEKNKNVLRDEFTALTMLTAGLARIKLGDGSIINSVNQYLLILSVEQSSFEMHQYVPIQNETAQYDPELLPMALDHDLLSPRPSSSVSACPYRPYGPDNVRNSPQLFPPADQPSQNRMASSVNTPEIFDTITDQLAPPHCDSTSPIVPETLRGMNVTHIRHTGERASWNIYPPSSGPSIDVQMPYGTPYNHAQNPQLAPAMPRGSDPSGLLHPTFAALHPPSGYFQLNPQVSGQAEYPSPSTSHLTSVVDATGVLPTNSNTGVLNVHSLTPSNGVLEQTRNYRIVVEREEDADSPLEIPGVKKLDFASPDDVRFNLLSRLQFHFTHPLFDWQTFKLRLVHKTIKKTFGSAVEVADRLFYHELSELVVSVIRV